MKAFLDRQATCWRVKRRRGPYHQTHARGSREPDGDGLILETAPRMTWYTWLIAAAIVTAIAAITGIKPKGTRHVTHTSMMGIARIVLLIFLAIVVFVALHARMGH